MIRREDDDHPTSPTVDAPSWLERGAARPGAPIAAPAERAALPRTPYATTEDADTTPDSPPGAVRAAPPPLRRIHQFMLLERIGAGGMGEVFAAFDEKLGRKVAIKLVATQTSGDRARQRLLREAQALARLSHPNVVTVYEVGALPDGGLFIAMELVSGQTLRAWQRAHRGAWREIVAVYAEAGRGLAAAHKSGIVHRDFKPDNVLVGDDGRVRVADFGLAFAADDALPAKAPPDPAPAPASAARVSVARASAPLPVADASAALPVPDVTAGAPAARRSGSLFARASASLRRVEASAAVPLTELNAALRADSSPGKLADASAALPIADTGAGSPATDASSALPIADIGAAPRTETSAALPRADVSAAVPSGQAGAALPARASAPSLGRDAAAASSRDEMSAALPPVTVDLPAADARITAAVAPPRAGSMAAAPGGAATQAALRPEEVTAALSRIAPGAALSRSAASAARPGGDASAAPSRDHARTDTAGGVSPAWSRDKIAAATARDDASAARSRDEVAATARDDASAALPRDEISAALRPGSDTSAVLPPLIEESAALSPLADDVLPFFDPDPDADLPGVDVRTPLLRLDTDAALPDGDPSGERPPVEARAAWSPSPPSPSPSSEASTGLFRSELLLASPSPDGDVPEPAHPPGRPDAVLGRVGNSSQRAAGARPHRTAGDRANTAPYTPSHSATATRSDLATAARANRAADAAVLGPTADIESTMDLEPELLVPPPSAPRLTVAGRFVGTPGYMAPEQLAGTAVDARADQYSFCVALYEALHGERPAADTTAPSHRSEPARYPHWLAELLQRGLSPDPARRFPTMDALLGDLTRSRERTRRRTAVAVLLGALLAAAAAMVIVRSTAEPPPCPLADDELAGIWDATARQRSQAALLGTGTPYAASMWKSTAAAFDRYADRWLAAQQAACKATHVRHVQSAELLDRRMECLASRRRSLAAAADVLQRQPAQAVGHASELLDSLGDIEQCGDTGALLAQSGPGAGSPTASPATRARAAAVRQQLANATALLATGDVAAAEPIVAAADKLARDIHDDALQAELAYSSGKIKLARGELQEALAQMNRAIELAVASHHDELAPDVWLDLAISAGSRNQRPAEIEQWIAQSEGWLRRLGHTNDSRYVRLELARGMLQYTAGNPREAVATISHAVELAEDRWGKDDPRLVPLLRTRANAHGRLHDPKAAIADGERALALGIASWGPHYPDIARTHRALGLLYIEQAGDPLRGEQEINLARDLYQHQLGADSIEVANCEQALSQADKFQGDYTSALKHAERAEQIFAARLGPEHARRGEALAGIGALRFMRGEFKESLAAYETAYEVLRASLGNEHTNIGILLSNTGETLLALGYHKRALEHFTKALNILQRHLGKDHIDLALPLKGIGLSHLNSGHPKDARAPLERALALRSHFPTAGDPQEIAETRWALARTLRELGDDIPRSYALALAARDGYQRLGATWSQRARDIVQWLATMNEPASRSRP